MLELPKNALASTFGGQAGQEQGMGLEALEKSDKGRQIFFIASEVTGEDIAEYIRTTDTKDMKGPIVQPALGAAMLADFFYALERGLEPDVLIGSSVSEIIALGAAGAFSLEDTFRILTVRGIEMEKANQINPGIMKAFLGSTAEEFAWVLSLVNRRLARLKKTQVYEGMNNWAKQQVASGDEDAINFMAEAFELLGRIKKVGNVKVKMVKDDGASHAGHMEPAVPPVYEAVAAARKKKPIFPVIANNGRLLDKPGQYADYVSGQLVKSADTQLSLWVAVLLGVRRFQENGGKKLMTSFVGKEFPQRETVEMPFGDIIQVNFVPDVPVNIAKKILALAA